MTSEEALSGGTSASGGAVGGETSASGGATVNGGTVTSGGAVFSGETIGSGVFSGRMSGGTCHNGEQLLDDMTLIFLMISPQSN